MANDFKVVLSTSVNTTDLKTQLDNFFKNYKAPISTSIGGSSGSGSGSNSTSAKISDIQKIGAENLKWEQSRIKLITQAEEINKKFDQERILGQEKLNAEFAKYQQQVDIFMAKNQNRDWTKPGAQGELDVVNNMQGVLNGPVTPEAVEQIKNYSGALKVAQANTQGLNAGLKDTGLNLLDVAKNLGITITAMQAMQFVISQIKDGVQYIKDLDKELTNIRLVTGQSKESVYALGKEYNQTAKELGVTTLEVAKSSVEFIRQGKTAEETSQLIRNATMLSKLGNLEAADSADKLTSIMNGFKLSVEETGPVLDKLVALDNSYASSVGEIGTALKYSSNSAQQAGVDFDHLAAYITVISSTTRQSAETIGNSLKTMLARFTDIKNGAIDEDGLKLNNVEIALSRINVKLRDGHNNIRDIQDVLADVGKKWSSINELEQDNIAKSIAGKK